VPEPVIRAALVGSLLAFVFPPGAPRAADRPAGGPYAARSAVMAPHGMVCASQPLAAQIGLEILRRGGSAVDAAIAVNAALGLMEPTSCGVGGDLFALVWTAADGRLHGLKIGRASCRERV